MIAAAVSAISTWIVIGCEGDADDCDLNCDALVRLWHFARFIYHQYCCCAFVFVFWFVFVFLFCLCLWLLVCHCILHLFTFATGFINHRSCRCGLMWHWKRPCVAFHSQTVSREDIFQSNQCIEAFSRDENVKKHKKKTLCCIPQSHCLRRFIKTHGQWSWSSWSLLASETVSYLCLCLCLCLCLRWKLPRSWVLLLRHCVIMRLLVGAETKI